ncbi:MAG TPA: hypothetical protein VFM36_12635 [Thermoanaerobaculia bacterium]|nr:hypothetical protein [Thermoanaerobaculia bacterium]
MTHRIRILVAIAILFALAAHPLEHPLVKECPCVHSAATAAVGRVDVAIAPAHARSFVSSAVRVAEMPDLAVRASRAPPAI